MRRRNALVEKIANSRDARSPAAESSTTMYRCSSPRCGDSSDSDETCLHCARAVERRSRTRIPALNFRTVLIDQSLKARVFADRIPRRIKFETGNGHFARPTHQSIQQLNRAIVLAEDRVN